MSPAVTGRKPTPRRSSPTELERARRHIQHVIVLMMENRSFDHMLGFLDHPDHNFPGLAGQRYDNPFLLPRTRPMTPVSPDAEHRSYFDPPHGHLSAKMAMHGERWRNFKMDGFVASNAEKLSGKEPIAVPHWNRVILVGLLLSVVTAAGLHNLSRLGVNGGWGHVVWWVVAGVLAGAAVIALLALHQLPGRRGQQFILPVLVSGAFGGLAAHGVWSSGARRGIGTCMVASAFATIWLLWSLSRRLKQRARVSAEKLGTASTRVMHCMSPDKLPVLAELARRYTTCTQWFSSVPGATWPNRNFAHAATSEESVDIEVGFYEGTTIFERLDEAHPQDINSSATFTTWRIYHHDTPQVVAYDALWKGRMAKNWFGISRLFRDIREGTLPMYAFVEPCHTGEQSNSQHPGNNQHNGDDFQRGEQLIADIYNTLVESEETFAKTLFVITYDEHGGLFDHEPPPPSRHPERLRERRKRGGPARRLVAFFVEYPKANFDFRCLGPRVPAVVVSPRVERGMLDSTLYELACIPASLRLLFASERPPLTRRDEVASDFLHLVRDDLTSPRKLADDNERPRRMAKRVAELAGTEDAGGLTATTGDDLSRQLAALRSQVVAALGTTGLQDERPRTTVGAEADVPTAVLFQQHAQRQRGQ